MIRIQGIVKAAQIARSQLQAGVPPSRLLSFQGFIKETLGKIDEICANANMSPAQLPTPSRKAYEFLAQIDLSNLPVGSHNSPSVSVQPIRLKNIRNQQRQVLAAIASTVANPQNSHSQKQQLLKSLQETVATIEGICTQQNATPAQLNKTSRQTYAWMKFLTDESNLERHLSATRRTQKRAEEMLWTQMQHPCKTIAVEFTNMTHLYKGKIGPLEAIAQINEAFVNATDEILYALVRLAFLGKNQEDSQVIKEYALSEEYSEVVLELDFIADTEAENPQGKCYNLDRLFHTLNREYFGGKMLKPRLSWNRSFTTRKFGHYERGRDRVVLSISLDSDRVPEYVVEFVLYHELLHKQHEGKWVNGRLNVHTREFRQDEQKFCKYKEADQWLTRLASE
ncbi:M48 family peptidase [Phormidium pseudopriestleyi FRX01]|uniref:M48 family peptidase n=1 Tax=Phormidium pseudopriestleyi FRX01 TaxID=1759528 RepID=A0ABS3FLJ9_9CYAN|nr:M48 family peptidase [Phormidium pseudopriestleyi]MBO0347969.1 M48 family peptidase [Phormidium pseudopriestleyi FRX01]